MTQTELRGGHITVGMGHGFMVLPPAMLSLGVKTNMNL